MEIEVRLTQTQSKFMQELLSEPIGTTMECAKWERKTAESLQKKGLLSILPGESFMGHFEVRANPPSA